MKHQNSQAGFTAIELLITLFVAAAFLIAGYQLFSLVVRDGGAVNAESVASNIAYDHLRRYETATSDPCVARTPLRSGRVEGEGLANPTVTVTITCPSSATPGLSQITSRVEYGNEPRRSVEYSTYANGSTAASTITSDIVLWLKMNGNLTTSAGTKNGSNSTFAYDAGENSANPGAIVFGPSATLSSGTDDIDIGHAPELALTHNFTVSAWIRPAYLTAEFPLYSTQGNAAITSYPLAFQLMIGPGSGGVGRLYVKTGTSTFESVNNTIGINTWQHVAFVKGDSCLPGKLYVNGSEVPYAISDTTCNYADYGRTKTMGSTSVNWGGGRVDDFRIYSRALSGGEIARLFSEGSQ